MTEFTVSTVPHCAMPLVDSIVISCLLLWESVQQGIARMEGWSARTFMRTVAAPSKLFLEGFHVGYAKVSVVLT